jgi:hypothetical protein
MNRHHISVQSPQVEIEMAGLDDECHIDVGGYHLIIHVLACTLAAQDRLSREYAMDYCRGVSVAALHSNPISDTRQVAGGLNLESEFPSEFGGNFPAFGSDKISAPVYGCHAGNRVALLRHTPDLCLKPLVKS